MQQNKNKQARKDWSHHVNDIRWMGGGEKPNCKNTGSSISVSCCSSRLQTLAWSKILVITSKKSLSSLVHTRLIVSPSTSTSCSLTWWMKTRKTNFPVSFFVFFFFFHCSFALCITVNANGKYKQGRPGNKAINNLWYEHFLMNFAISQLQATYNCMWWWI